MRRYLVVAHRTLGGAHLFEHLHELRAEDPYCGFHFVVPMHHPKDHAFTDHECRVAAQAKLDEILENMATLGIGATGEVGDVNPVYAVDAAFRHEDINTFTGIVLSTLPQAISSWWDVPHRVHRQFPSLPLTHIVAEDSLVS